MWCLMSKKRFHTSKMFKFTLLHPGRGHIVRFWSFTTFTHLQVNGNQIFLKRTNHCLARQPSIYLTDFWNILSVRGKIIENKPETIPNPHNILSRTFFGFQYNQLKHLLWSKFTNVQVSFKLIKSRRHRHFLRTKIFC